MRSLTWAVGSPPEIVRALSEWLRAAEYRDVNRTVNNFLVSLGELAIKDGEARLPDDVATAAATSILSISHSQGDGRAYLPENVRETVSATTWSGIVRSHTGKSGVEPWAGEARSLLLLQPGNLIEAATASRELADIGVMLKCTAEANARRDAVVMQQVMQRLSFSSAKHKKMSLEAVSQKALSLAIEITGSVGGAVYFSSTSSSPPTFQRVASQAGVGFAFPGSIALGEKTTLGWSVERHRAYQRISSSRAAEALTPAVEADGGTELVTPISGPLADTLAPAVGAIVLFHPAGEPRGYSAYERALVRNVALRLALFRTNIATREIANAISVLRSGSPRRLQTSGKKIESSIGVGWPKDIIQATARFAQPLKQLADSTHSHSVTLRIALPDAETTRPHGLALARVAAHPAERLEDPYEREREGDPGLHWDVMRDGHEEYAPNIRGNSHFPEVRPGTVSTLCVPVRIEGVLAGTLNLESPFVDNYAPFLPLIMALSGAVGRTLADARAEIESGLLDRTAHALGKRHEYSGVLSALQKGLESVSSQDLRQALIDKAESLRTLIQDLREPDMPATLPAKSLWQIVGDNLRNAELAASTECPTETLFHIKLSPRASRAVSTVLNSVFRNVSYHSSPDGRDFNGERVPRVRFDVVRLGGARRAVIVIENLTERILETDFCTTLYRYPTETLNGEIRLGTYIAGLNARRVGAHIHAVPIQGGRGLRTTVIVPVEVLRDTANDG
ncbi:hypothetical protein DFJ67_6818 [Asanoa ferruginea]|uniref:GAF domain-containing protein n=2 Tax=Asanoa ferruginea TaxID=53367 RepID=A0A3E0A368_9ACTN|nr:hypothetical protein DFJ67_6818 [Asanoa ferruginea]